MDLLQALLGELVGDLHDRHDVRAGALGDRDRVAEVVAVAVRQQDRIRAQIVGGDRRLRVAGEERVDQHSRVSVGQLEGRVAKEADLHLSCSSSVVGGFRAPPS